MRTYRVSFWGILRAAQHRRKGHRTQAYWTPKGDVISCETCGKSWY